MKIMRNKLALSLLIVSGLLFGSLFGLGILLNNRVNAYVFNLADKITKQIGHPVTIEKVTTKWDWLFLKISIKNLVISSQNPEVPLFMAGEIVSTVDALDSLRTFSLKFKHLLLRNPRLVMQWDGNGAPSVLGLTPKNDTGDINPAGVLKILDMQRSITVENGDFHLQGIDGADLPFMDVKLEFNHRGTKEYNLIARGNIAAAVQPEFVIAANYYGELQDYKAAMLDFEIKTSNLQLAELFNFIPKYRQDIVQGEFKDFDLRGTVQNGTVRNIKSDFTITKIIVDKDTVINSGSGYVEFVPGSNRCKLQLINATLMNDHLFTHPINVDSIRSDINYQELEDGTVNITTDNAHIKFMELEANPTIDLKLVNNNLNNLNFKSDLSDASVRKLLVLLPDKMMPSSLTQWFDQSLISGTVNNLKLDYQNKKLSWSLGFKNAELKYSPEWPSVHGIDATLAMSAGKLTLNATKAMILDEEIRSLDVDFSAYKGMPYAVVNINGMMNTTLANGMAFLQQTPLQQTLGKELAIFKPTGAIGLDLRLKINVSDTVEPIKVAINMDLHDDTLQAPDLGISLDKITGKIKITNNSVKSENLQLSVLGQMATAKISMDSSSIMKMSINTPVRITDLQKMMPNLDISKFSGATKITASISLPLGDGKLNKVVNISSDMVGIDVNYPAPFNKVSKSSMPLHLVYQTTGNEQDNLRIKYGSLIDAILFLNKNKLGGAHIAINKRLDTTSFTDSLHVVGTIPIFEWALWQPLVQNTGQEPSLPIEMDVAVNRLKLEDSEYESLKIKYFSNRQELFIDSPIVTGTVYASPEFDKISIKLAKLNLPEQKTPANKNNKLLDYLQEQRAKNKLPNIQFSCDKLLIKKQTLKNINLELLPHSYGYEIMNFSIINDNIKLLSKGRWHMDDQAYTIINGNAYTNNFGKVLAEWGYLDSMSRGKGELNFSVQWNGAPTSFDLFNLSGNAHLDLRLGSLTNINPGLGRIIGLLSLESIQRRLQLDFSDLISRGFAFDKLVADVKLEPGRLVSENILINSPAAKIEMLGKTSIQSKELDFTMYVTPKVGAGLPIAAAIAAGPAVGAAIWLFDKASGSKISELTKYKYLVTGTWDKPKIDEVSDSNKKIAGIG